MRGTLVAVAALLVAVAAGAAEPPGLVVVGLDLHMSPERTKAFGDSFRGALGATAGGTTLRVVDDCEDVTFCITAVAVPVLVGAREGGTAISAHVSRRLVDDPLWPWPRRRAGARAEASEAPKVVIEDAYSVEGECLECQEALDRMLRRLQVLEGYADEIMIDQGGQQLWVGSERSDFVIGTAGGFATTFREVHLGPWLRSWTVQP
jgi:hypothetical protein